MAAVDATPEDDTLHADRPVLTHFVLCCFDAPPPGDAPDRTVYVGPTVPYMGPDRPYDQWRESVTGAILNNTDNLFGRGGVVTITGRAPAAVYMMIGAALGTGLTVTTTVGDSTAPIFRFNSGPQSAVPSRSRFTCETASRNPRAHLVFLGRASQGGVYRSFENNPEMEQLVRCTGSAVPSAEWSRTEILANEPFNVTPQDVNEHAHEIFELLRSVFPRGADNNTPVYLLSALPNALNLAIGCDWRPLVAPRPLFVLDRVGIWGVRLVGPLL